MYIGCITLGPKRPVQPQRSAAGPEPCGGSGRRDNKCETPNKPREQTPGHRTSGSPPPSDLAAGAGPLPHSRWRRQGKFGI